MRVLLPASCEGHIPRIVFATVLMLLAAGCAPKDSQDAGPAPGPAPTEPAMDPEVDEPEVARRQTPSETENDTPPAGRPDDWAALEDKPVLDLVEPASVEDVKRWLADLGEVKGERARKASTNLILQGLRVAGRLEAAVSRETLAGVQAAEILAVLRPEIRLAWTTSPTTEGVFVDSGTGYLVWGGESGFDLKLLDTEDGKPKWQNTRKEVAEFLGDERLEGWVHPRLQEVESDTAIWQVMNYRKADYVVTLKDGALAKAVGQPATVRKGLFPPPWQAGVETVVRVEGRGTVRWYPGRVAVKRATEEDWLPLTAGQLSPDFRGVEFTGHRIYALARETLYTYHWVTLRLESNLQIPGKPDWIHVSNRSGLVVLAGRGWNQFAVLGGTPPHPMGRVPGNIGAMTAMAADPEDRWIAIADSEKLIHIFLAETLERIATIAPGESVDKLEFSPDGATLLAMSPGYDRGREFRTVRAYRFDAPQPPK